MFLSENCGWSRSSEKYFFLSSSYNLHASKGGCDGYYPCLWGCAWAPFRLILNRFCLVFFSNFIFSDNFKILFSTIQRHFYSLWHEILNFIWSYHFNYSMFFLSGNLSFWCCGAFHEDWRCSQLFFSS